MYNEIVNDSSNLKQEALIDEKSAAELITVSEETNSMEIATGNDLSQETSEFEINNIEITNINESFKNSLSISNIEINNQNIRDFDVDKKGNIIICLNNNSVNVYNSSLEFLYSINFDVNGTSIAFWYNEIPAIYISKTDEIIQVDKSGIISAYKVKNTIENSIIYNQIRGNRTIINEDYSYKLCYSSFLQKVMMINPTQLIRENEGNEVVIYENCKATSNALIRLLLIALFGFVFILIFKYAKKISFNYNKTSNKL